MSYLYKGLITLISIFFLIKANSQQTVGLFTEAPGSLDGYVLFAPMTSDTTYLIDKCGKKVHSWTSEYHPGLAVYLLPDGNLLRTACVNNPLFNTGGNGGLIQKFDWDGNLIWSYPISSAFECQHHDVKQLPNGNILVIVWEYKTTAEAIAAGRDPTLLGNSLWGEKIIELQPIDSDEANIVWEWHAWDHLVQNFDYTKLNYGDISNAELINLNYEANTGPQGADWLHVNGIDYNADFDQIMISSHNFNEIWIIDHSTTTTEAASHSGGIYGKGGDILYRWGNPAAFNHGAVANQQFFGQHNPRWIEHGYPDSGKIMVFNNGLDRPGGDYSTVDIITPDVDALGNYGTPGIGGYLPEGETWHYQAPNPFDFFSANISGAQRLSNGNTIVCEGNSGNFFEIDTNDSIVWYYINPVFAGGIISQGNLATANSVFRCTLYEPSYSGFNGHSLIPGNPIEFNPLPYTCEMFTGISPLHDHHSQDIFAVNPFSANLVLQSNAVISNASLFLFNEMGQVVESWKNIDLIADQAVDLALQQDLPPGVYFLQLRSSAQNASIKLLHIH